MKSMIKASLITALLVLTSCAHHRGCKGSCDKENCKKEGQCKMKGEQCPMKTDAAAAPAAPATEAPKK
ncbi:MAG: hypothetical protein EHM20_17010 [Alphaproteobacteria bacterium]|nr:MAG: hypothetical protein EHM20_17010 [Alphaproteobacteria bacterium]